MAIAQTNLNFNSVSVTTSGAIRLSWNSNGRSAGSWAGQLLQRHAVGLSGP
jgi:hypothetical protein